MDAAAEPLAEFRFEAEMIHWRGPSPFFFVPVPAAEAAESARLSRSVSYGWGVIPVQAAIGDAPFATSLFPKDGGYVLPVKAAVRRAAAVTAGDVVAVAMTVRPPA